MRKALLLLATLSSLTYSGFSDTGPDLWLTVNGPAQKIGDNTSTKSQLSIRFPEFDDLNYFYFAQKFTTKLNDKWSLGTHPVFEIAKKGDDWNNTYRLDLELNPSKFTLGENGPTIAMRNRWELRWREGEGSEIFHRIRHSSKATWKIDAGPFTSFSIGDEIFYEDHKGKITRNRFYPAIFDSKLGQRKISYYLLYQSDRAGTSDDWNGRYVLGSTLSF